MKLPSRHRHAGSEWNVAFHGMRFGQNAAYARSWSIRARLAASPAEKAHARECARTWAKQARAALADLNAAMGS